METDHTMGAAGADEAEPHESHEPPRGTLLIMVGYLLLMVALWMQAYLTLLGNGGIPQ